MTVVLGSGVTLSGWHAVGTTDSGVEISYAGSISGSPAYSLKSDPPPELPDDTCWLSRGFYVEGVQGFTTQLYIKEMPSWEHVADCSPCDSPPVLAVGKWNEVSIPFWCGHSSQVRMGSPLQPSPVFWLDELPVSDHGYLPECS